MEQEGEAMSSNWLTAEFMRRRNRERQMPQWPKGAPMMWSSGIDGPALVRFKSAETGSLGEHLRVYLDVRSILSIEQKREGGSIVVLTSGVPYHLHDGATEVIERIKQASEQMAGL